MIVRFSTLTSINILGCCLIGYNLGVGLQHGALLN